MSGGERNRALLPAAIVALVIVVSGGASAGRAQTPVDTDEAAPWSEVFASESDTVAFIGAGGELVRAPFHLATRETLWVPTGGERLARLRVSPRGGVIAWITRRADGDTTRLWIGRARHARARVRYFALVSHPLGILRFEPGVPTLEDRGFRGARFLAPNAFMRRFSSNTLEWMPDGSGVVFGTHEGIAFAHADGGIAGEVSAALGLQLRPLEPASIFLLEAIVETGTGRREDWLLLYPDRERWRLFPTSGLERAEHWTASTTTVWWSRGRTLRAVHAHSPSPTDEFEADAPVIWLAHDGARGALAWVSGRRLQRMAEGGGPPQVVAEVAEPVVAVLESAEGGARCLVGSSSLTIWDPITDSLRTMATVGFRSTAMLELAGGDVVLISSERGSEMRIARVRPGGRQLEPIAWPKLKHPVVAASPGRHKLIAASGAADPPAVFHVLDPGTGAWTRVANPGITGWELLAPR